MDKMITEVQTEEDYQKELIYWGLKFANSCHHNIQLKSLLEDECRIRWNEWIKNLEKRINNDRR